MLDELLHLFRVNRGPLATALFFGVLLGVIFGWSLDRVGGASPTLASTATATPTVDLPPPPTRGPKKSSEIPRRIEGSEPVATATPDRRVPSRARIKAALERGIAAAERLGGDAEAAVLLDGWTTPLIAGRNRQRKMRMWSMSKPVAAVAVLEAAQRTPDPPSAELSRALTGAITRSENCRQRRVVLGLQVLAGGPDQAKAAFESVLRRAGDTRVKIVEPPHAPEGACADWWKTQTGVNPQNDAYQLGIVEWTVADAVRFAFALGKGIYGSAGAHVLDLMARPKRNSREAEDGDYTPGLNWGAGEVFGRVPYKAGWGGYQHGNYMAGQYVVLAGGRAALAVMFHPSTQPPNDDPGQTAAPRAIEAIMRAVKPELPASG